MIRAAVSLLLAMVGFVLVNATDTSALSLKIAPLDYNATLEKAEVKKGYVDVSNPEYQPVNVELDVQAFRQIDNEGSIQFYDDEQIDAGILLDYDTLKLGPREAVRVYFLLDGTKLPSGDVFAAIFASIVPESEEAATQSVRVGTILQIVNGTPGERIAEVTAADIPFVQFGETLSGSYTIKNTAGEKSTSGFSPEVQVSLLPFKTTQTVESPLVFAGRERANDFSLTFNRFGVYRVNVEYGDSVQSRWVLLLTQQGLAILALVVVGSIGLVLLIRRYGSNVKFTTKRRR